MTNKHKGMILVFGTALISGLAVFISKFGVSVVNPYIFTGWKNIAVAILAAVWLLFARDGHRLKDLKPRQWASLVLVGLMGGAVPFLLFFKGLAMTSAVQGSFIHKTMFIYAAILAAIFLKEKISRNFVIASMALLLGNVLLLGLAPRQFGAGDGLVFLATLFWAGENVLSKYLLGAVSARIVIWARMFFGAGFIALFWLLTGQLGAALFLDLAQIGWVVIASVLLFGYVATWYTGLRYTNVSTATAILLLGGPITVLLSWLFDGGTIPMAQGAGMILISLAAFFIGKFFLHDDRQKTIGAV